MSIEPKVIKVHVGGSSTSSGSLSIAARETIEKHLFTIAKEHAQLASENVDRENVPKMQIEMKHSIIAIVMSFTALEALSNDLYKKITGNDFDSDEFKKFDNNPIKKWKKLAKLAFRLKNPSEQLRLPSNFTKALNEIRILRNQIIHYKPKPENIETLRRTPDNHVVSPELAIFTSKEATKAVQTVRTLLKTFEEITGYEVPKLE